MKKSVIVTMSIIVSLALGELYLRLLLPQQTYGRLPDTGSGCYRDDTELYALPKPDGSCSAKTSEYSVETPINHQGFVGIDAVAPEKAPDTIRVAFIGDSYTFGQGVPFTSAYPYVTGQLLTKNGRKTEVINASMIGAGPHWYYLRLKTSVMRFAPDIVVVGLYLGNDLTDTTYFTSGTDDADGMPLSVRTPNEYVDGSGKRQAAETPLR